LAALGGLLAVSAKQVGSLNLAQLRDEGNDDIATSKTDDMFAFSQIIAAG
jgi:hypothetical protein